MKFLPCPVTCNFDIAYLSLDDIAMLLNLIKLNVNYIKYLFQFLAYFSTMHSLVIWQCDLLDDFHLLNLSNVVKTQIDHYKITVWSSFTVLRLKERIKLCCIFSKVPDRTVFIFKVKSLQSVVRQAGIVTRIAN